jgi:hypothetical protein
MRTESAAFAVDAAKYCRVDGERATADEKRRAEEVD